MSTIETAVSISEIVGGIGILVSLLYVGYQIRQNNRYAEAESIRATMQGTDFLSQYNMAVIGRGFNDFTSLSYDEKWEFHCYFIRYFNHYQMVVQSRDLGLIPDVLADPWTKGIAEVVLTKGVQQYFQDGARDTYHSPALHGLEDYIKSNRTSIIPYNEQMGWLSPDGN